MHLIERSSIIEQQVLVPDLIERAHCGLGKYLACPNGSLFFDKKIFLGENGVAKISDYVKSLGGKLQKSFCGSYWISPEGKLLAWLSNVHGRKYYCLLKYDKKKFVFIEAAFLVYDECCLDVVDAGIIPNAILKAFEDRFGIKMDRSFLKSSEDSPKLRAISQAVRLRLHVISAKKRSFDWENVFHQMYANHLFCSFLIHQSPELADLGGAIQKIGLNCFHWVPPEGSKLFGFNFIEDKDEYDKATGIIQKEAETYYVLVFCDKDYFLKHSNGCLQIVHDIPSSVLDYVARQIDKKA